ncbi:MAG: sensor histidine kinase [Woeseiaceae bacterium]
MSRELKQIIKEYLMPIVFVLPLFFLSSLTYADTIKIGLRAHVGVEKSMQRWKQTADYLSEQIPEHKFIMLPFVGIAELMDAAEKNKFDFVVTNPSSYVEMELRFGASAILTLRNKRQGKPYTKFGSVIFTRKESDIYKINDLKGRKIVAVSERAFGGWRVVLRELLREGFDVEKDLQNVSFTGGIQQDVVSFVQIGNADVGVVRTDMLERLDESGEINIDNFRIINAKTTADFPFYHSTPLYPEWAFIKMKNTPSQLSKQVALALLNITSNHPAPISGKYVGWTAREDYQPVHNLMKDLKIGPYRHYNESPVEHFFEEYLIQFIISVLFFISLLFVVLYILSINRKLVVAKSKQENLMNDLGERVAERTQDLVLAKEKAEQASAAKSEFLSNMSHELRTPMNAILGFAQIIESDIESKTLDNLQDNIGEVLIAGRHLLELVNDVLDLAKIETGKYDVKLEAVIVADIVNNVVSLLEVLASKNNIEIICDFNNKNDVVINVDARLLQQILINIITNAIKYNKEKGKITISISREDDDHCKISVADTGDGIAADHLEKIFEPFERVTTRTTIEGSGVGLSITKNLAEIMDGQVLVESTLGEGSTFSLCFKLAN